MAETSEVRCVMFWDLGNLLQHRRDRHPAFGGRLLQRPVPMAAVVQACQVEHGRRTSIGGHDLGERLLEQRRI